MAATAQKLAGRRHLRFPDQKVFLLGLVAAIVAFLTVIPLAILVWGSIRTGDPTVADAAFTIQNYVTVFTDPTSLELFINSLWYATGACLLSLVIGTTLAWIVERTNTPFRKVLYALTLVPLIVPGVLVTVAWLFLLNPRNGFVNYVLMSLMGLQKAPFDIYTMWGMIWIEALHFVPLVFILMGAALRSMDPSLEESAMMSGASVFVTLRRVTLKLMLPAVASVSLIMFVRALESFEVPALVGLPGRIFVLTSKIYEATRQYPPQFGISAALSMSLLVLGVVGLYFYYRVTARSERFATVTGKAFRPRTTDLGRWRYLTVGIYMAYLFVVVVLPLFILAWTSLNPFYRQPDLNALDKLSMDNFRAVLSLPIAQKAFLNSFLLAFGSATATMLLTAIIAWITVKTTIPGRQILDAFAFVPIAFPGIVLGVALLWVYLVLPIPIYGTIWILVVAYMTRFMPYGIRACSSSVIQIHKELEEAAYTSGASWLHTFGRVVLPLLRPALLAGWIYIMIMSFKELSTSILLYSSESIVLSVLVFDLWGSGKIGAISALAMMMIAVLMLLVLIMQKIGGKFGVQG
ncbi:MAG: iron ABC transporter permease [Chloroflexi bacterium]|nr:iron ABC transporter permease [Chloroflexota bacterium]